MNYDEIIEKLQKVDDNVGEFAHGDFPKELGETKEVFRKGGEGEGEDWQRVYHFIEHNVFIKFTGHYTSYSGTDFSDGWGGCSQVVPKEETVIVYEAK